jgi:hypothetical protein
VTVAPTGPPGGGKPSKAWMGLLALGVAVIVLLATCLVGVFYDVNSRVRDVPPSPSPRFTPPPSTPVPLSPSGQSPGPGAAEAAFGTR